MKNLKKTKEVRIMPFVIMLKYCSQINVNIKQIETK